MDNLSICCMNKSFSSIQHIYKLSLFFMDENFMSIQHIDKLYIFLWTIFSVHTTYGQAVYMLYGQVVYICHIDKDMSDDTEQVHNESIDMTHLRKRYMNIAPTRHNISFTEWKNLPYNVLLGFTPHWNIVITTQCTGWGSSSVLISPQKSDNSHQKMIRQEVFHI